MKDDKKVEIKDENTLFEMFDYLCSKVNWGKSFLDADAIACMNTMFIELRKEQYQGKVELK
jgi:hypothetical protein